MNTTDLDTTHHCIRQIFHRLKEASQSILQELELTKVDINILLAIGKSQHISKNSLADRLSFKPSSLTRSIERLSKAGLLIRTNEESDRRFIDLSLTKKGYQLAKQYTHSMRTPVSKILKPLTTTELKQLGNTLAKITSHLNHPTDSE